MANKICEFHGDMASIKHGLTKLHRSLIQRFHRRKLVLRNLRELGCGPLH
jgi:hypothetical protein